MAEVIYQPSRDGTDPYAVATFPTTPGTSSVAVTVIDVVADSTVATSTGTATQSAADTTKWIWSASDITGIDINVGHWQLEIVFAATLSTGGVIKDSVPMVLNGGTLITGQVVDGLPDQINQILASGGINVSANSDSTITVGTPTGTYVNTIQRDGSYWQIDNVGNEIDMYLETVIPADGAPQTATFFGRMTTAGDSIDVYAYNWGTASWEQIDTLGGSGSDEAFQIAFLNTHVGDTGADIGKIRARFFATGLTGGAALYIDQFFFSYAVQNRSVGYALGSIWVSDSGGSGTTPFIDGTADNPVTWAAALTINAALTQPLNRFQVANGSTITLSAAADNYTLEGWGWALALGGQSISDAVFVGASVSGTGTAVGMPTFSRCYMNTVTLPPCRLISCTFAATLTVGSAGDFFALRCESAVAGTGTPVTDFGAFAVNFSFRAYSGGQEFRNVKAGDSISLEGHGQYILAASCSGGVLANRGAFDETRLDGGAVSVVRTAAIPGAEVNLVNDAITAAKIANDAIGASEIANGAIDAATFAAGAVDAAALATDAVNEIRDAILADSTAFNGADIAAILTDTGTTLPAAIAGVQADTDDIQTRLPAALVGGRMDSDVGNMQTDTVDANALATDAVEEIADQVWDEVLSGVSHNDPQSAGRRLRQAQSALFIEDGTAQAGGANSITLAAGANANDDYYEHNLIVITGGTGQGQTRTIDTYNGTTKVATVLQAYVVQPDATSEYAIWGSGATHVQKLHPDTITAAVVATDAIDADAIASDVYTELTTEVGAGYEDGCVFLSKAGNDSNPGTITKPMLTLDAAITKARAVGMGTVRIVGGVYPFWTLGVSASGLKIETEAGYAYIDLNGQNITGSEWRRCWLIGDAGAGNESWSAVQCFLGGTLTNFNGEAIECVLYDNLSILPFVTTLSSATFADCKSWVDELSGYVPAPGGRPIVNLAGDRTQTYFNRWSGYLDIEGMNNANSVCYINSVAGEVTLAADNTLGTIVVRGSCTLTDNTAGATVLDERDTQSISTDGIADAVWDELRSGHTAAGSMGEALKFIFDSAAGRWKVNSSTNQLELYEDDNSTAVATFDLFKTDGTPTAVLSLIAERTRDT